MQHFLSFRVTGTEGTVEFEMIDIIQETTSDREQDVLNNSKIIIFPSNGCLANSIWLVRHFNNKCRIPYYSKL